MNISIKRSIGVLILVMFVLRICNAQPDSALVDSEKKISVLFEKISQLPIYNRDTSAEKLFILIDSTLQISGSFDYPFNSVKKIGKIYSPDKQLRIYSWNIPVGAGQDLYYSIFQYRSKQDKNSRTIKIRGIGNTADTISINNWPGALYYEIVETKHAGEKFYTLLGFDLGDLLTNKKVIDVITIDNYDELRFCRSLLNYEGKLSDRIVFEYSEKVNMMLKYNQKLDMIVFDHLSPEKPSLINNYQYYGPDFSYDGLKFDKGIWVHQKNIVITN